MPVTPQTRFRCSPGTVESSAARPPTPSRARARLPHSRPSSPAPSSWCARIPASRRSTTSPARRWWPCSAPPTSRRSGLYRAKKIKNKGEIINVREHRGAARHGDRPRRRLWQRRRAALRLEARPRTPTNGRSSGSYFSYDPYAIMIPRNNDDFRLLADKAIAKMFQSGEIACRLQEVVRSDRQPLNPLLEAENFQLIACRIDRRRIGATAFGGQRMELQLGLGPAVHRAVFRLPGERPAHHDADRARGLGDRLLAGLGARHRPHGRQSRRCASRRRPMSSCSAAFRCWCRCSCGSSWCPRSCRATGAAGSSATCRIRNS